MRYDIEELHTFIEESFLDSELPECTSSVRQLPTAEEIAEERRLRKVAKEIQMGLVKEFWLIFNNTLVAGNLKDIAGVSTATLYRMYNRYDMKEIPAARATGRKLLDKLEYTNDAVSVYVLEQFTELSLSRMARDREDKKRVHECHQQIIKDVWSIFLKEKENENSKY